MSTIITDSPRLSPQFRLQWEDAQRSWVLLYPEGMVKLNRSAGEILKRCDGATAVDAITQDLERAFETQGLDKEVQSFLEIAHGQGWIEADPDESSRTSP